MEIFDKIINEINRDSIDGRFMGSWHIEGSQSEKNKFCKTLEKSLLSKSGEITCIRLRRYTKNVEILKLGEPYRECVRLYLLRIDINPTGKKPAFGNLPKRKKRRKK